MLILYVVYVAINKFFFLKKEWLVVSFQWIPYSFSNNKVVSFLHI